MRKIIWLLLPIFLYAVVPNDGEYLVAKSGNSTIIYAAEYAKEAEQAAALWQALQPIYNSEFRYTHKRPYIMLTSSRNQIANAWATSAPLTMMQLYPDGASSINYMGYNSWLQTLIAHEGAHLYQLANKSEVSEYMDMVLGANVMPVVVGIVPFWTLPNAFLPQMFLEGNAVYNESKITGEGRLYGGQHKALFMVLLKAGLLNDTRLLNNHIWFPYLTEKYIVGGFFQAWLAKNYGDVNGLFAEHSYRYINPFLLNISHYNYFRRDFYALIDQFLSSYRLQAEAFNVQTGTTVSKNVQFAPIGSNGDQLLVYESDAKTYSAIVTVDRNTLKQTRINGFFQSGKPFCGSFGCATASSGYSKTAVIQTSLYDKNSNAIEQFNGKVVQDISGKNILYFDTKASFETPILYSNDQLIGKVVSEALYGADGSIYTVRFNDHIRTFYKDKTALFSVNYEAFLADILPNGDILFTAPTTLGNGLFIYQNGAIRRLGNGDNIVEAKYINSDQYLITTVTADGYETLIARLNTANELPVRPERVQSDHKPFDQNLTAVPLNAKTYNSLSMLRYASLYPSFTLLGNDFAGSLDLTFTDPMEFNAFTLGYLYGEKSYASASYQNSRYRLYYALRAFGELNATRDDKERKYGGEALAGFLLYNDNTDQWDLQVRKQFDPDDRFHNPLIASLLYQHNISFARARFSEFAANVALKNRTNKRDDHNDITNGLSADITSRLFGDLYADIYGSYSKSNGTDIWITDQPQTVIDPLNFFLIDPPYLYQTREAKSAGGALKLPIDTPLYFSAFPLALHRVVPKAAYTQIWMDTAPNKHGKITAIDTISETEFSLTLDILAAHMYNISFELGAVKNSERSSEKYFFRLLMQ